MGQNNHADKRPLSPHLTIYRLPITAVLSITHRLTGLALFAGVLLMGWWVVLRVYGCNSCMSSFTSHPVVGYVLILFSIAFYYHLLNGIRHLFWDAGKGYEVSSATRSSWLVLIGTVVLTVGSWFLSFYL